MCHLNTLPFCTFFFFQGVPRYVDYDGTQNNAGESALSIKEKHTSKTYTAQTDLQLSG